MRTFIAVCMFLLVVLLLMVSIDLSRILKSGDVAPDFTAKDQTGTEIHLADFLGRKNIVLYFYPKDFSRGCTAEACNFRDHHEDIDEFDAVIIGISRDDAERHKLFSSTYGLPFHLLSDSGGSITRAYGATWFLGLFPSPKRITYVIDKQGIIRAAIHHELNVGRHLEEVLQALGSCSVRA